MHLVVPFLTILFHLGRETSLCDSVPTLLLVLGIVLFGSGVLCEDKMETDVKDVEFQTAYPWRCMRGRKRKRNACNHCLHCPVMSRQVQCPVRNPARKWWKPTSWCWKRRTPVSHENSSGQVDSDAVGKPVLRKQKGSKKKTRAQKWASEPSRDEMFALFKHRFLHVSEIMCGLQCGVDLDDLVKSIDPVRQF